MPSTTAHPRNNAARGLLACVAILVFAAAALVAGYGLALAPLVA